MAMKENIIEMNEFIINKYLKINNNKNSMIFYSK